MNSLRSNTSRMLSIALAARTPVAKALAPSAGLIVSGKISAIASDYLPWLLSYPIYGIASVAKLFGRGRLTFQLLRGVWDIWPAGATVFNNRFGAQPIHSLTGDALQTEKTRVKELTQRMQNCAKVIGSLSLWWGSCGLLGFEEAGELTPILPFSVTTLCLTGIAIASLNFFGAWMLSSNTGGALVLPTKATDDTLVELVPKVLVAARTNQHIGTDTPDRETLKRATVAYLLCSLGATDAKKHLGAFAIGDSFFINAHRDIPTDSAVRNRTLNSLIQGTTVTHNWNALMGQIGGNELLNECVDEALR